MKNKIWRRTGGRTAVAFLLAVVFFQAPCSVRTLWADEDEAVLQVEQTARWTDEKSFQAELKVEISGLKAWKEKNTELSDNEEEKPEVTQNPISESPSGETDSSFGDGCSPLLSGKEPGGTEEGAAVFSVEILESEEMFVSAAEALTASEAEKSLRLTLCVSEYFFLETASLPVGCTVSEMPVQEQKNENTGLTKINYTMQEEDFEKDTLTLAFSLLLLEEYRYPADSVSLPAVRESDGAGAVLEEVSGATAVILARASVPVLSLKGVTADFALSLTVENPSPKAGEKLRYCLDIVNTGDVMLENLLFTSEFSCPKVTQEWISAGGFSADGPTAVLTALKSGESRTLYLDVQLTEAQSGELGHRVLVEGKGPGSSVVSIRREASLTLPVQEKKADFSVKKTADRDSALPGETVTYQICIVNTGDITLHSVVGTERFQKEGISAVFLEQDGVVLSEDKTRAMIEALEPGEAASLKAEVILPQDLAGQELLNQVTVTTRETGTKTVEASAPVTVEVPDHSPAPVYTQALNPDAKASGEESSLKGTASSPETGDESDGELFTGILTVSLVTVYGVLWLWHRYDRLKKSKQKL
ncbi:MAG: DUF11 domain-containing protein [Clostridiales bacterium]|nr:DUF11 domain-containing protein [Clostridiales bacterium]